MSTVSQPSQYLGHQVHNNLVQAGHHGVPMMVQYQYQPVPGQVLPQSLTSSYHEATGAVTSGLAPGPGQEDPQVLLSPCSPLSQSSSHLSVRQHFLLGS